MENTHRGQNESQAQTNSAEITVIAKLKQTDVMLTSVDQNQISNLLTIFQYFEMVPEEARSGSEYVNQALPDFSEVHSEKTKAVPVGMQRRQCCNNISIVYSPS